MAIVDSVVLEGELASKVQEIIDALTGRLSLVDNFQGEGEVGQIATSQGPNSAPTWADPDGNGNGNGSEHSHPGTDLSADDLTTGVVPTERMLDAYRGITALGELLDLTVGGPATFLATTDFQGAVTGIALNEIENPEANKTFNMTTRTLKFLWTNPGGNPLELEGSGAYSGALLHVHQHTGNPGADTHLIEVESEDVDVHHFHSIGPNATIHSFASEVDGDTEHRFVIQVGGTLQWGPGDAGLDTNLYRPVADVLKTDDAFHAGGGVAADTVDELTTDAGVTVEGLVIKDSQIQELEARARFSRR